MASTIRTIRPSSCVNLTNNVANLESHSKDEAAENVLTNSWPLMGRGFNREDSVRESPTIGDGENRVPYYSAVDRSIRLGWSCGHIKTKLFLIEQGVELLDKFCEFLGVLLFCDSLTQNGHAFTFVRGHGSLPPLRARCGRKKSTRSRGKCKSVRGRRNACLNER